MMQSKDNAVASSGEQTCLASETYQTRLDADKTRLASGGCQTVLGVQPEAVPDKATVEDDQELYRSGDYIGEHYEVLAIHRGAWGSARYRDVSFERNFAVLYFTKR